MGAPGLGFSLRGWDVKEGIALDKKPLEGKLGFPTQVRTLSFKAEFEPQGPVAAIPLPPVGTFFSR